MKPYKISHELNKDILWCTFTSYPTDITLPEILYRLFNWTMQNKSNQILYSSSILSHDAWKVV